MKRILFYIDHRNRGGAQRVMVELANYFQEHHQYEVIYAAQIESLPNAYELSDKVKGIVIGDKRTKSFIKKQLYRVKNLKKICQEEKPDVIISFLIITNIISLIVGMITKIPVIISVRNDPLHDHSRGLHILMRMFYPRAKGWVFQTKDAESYYRNWVRGTSRIIMNPIASSVLEEIEKGKITGENRNNIVAVGRLDKQKRHDLLIRAYQLACGENSEYKLVIYGEGAERLNLQKQINESGLQNNVILAGVTTNVVEKIRSAKIFILSSDYEGMPNSLLEAMAVGLPVISTDCPCGGPAMVIENGINGLLVEAGNEEALAEGIKKLLSDNELAQKLGRNASQIREKCNIDRIALMWKDAIDRCAAIREV